MALVCPTFYEKDSNNENVLIKNKYLYIIYEFNDNGFPRQPFTDENGFENKFCFCYYIWEDGKAYHRNVNEEVNIEKMTKRPMYANKYYFFVSPHYYSNPLNIIKREFCSEQMTITGDLEQTVNIDNLFFNLYLYPRKKNNLLEEAEDNTKKIKDILETYRPKTREAFEQNVKEIEYNYYLDLTPDDNTLYAQREFSAFIEINRKEENNSNEQRKLYKSPDFDNKNIILKLEIASGSDDFKFVNNNSLVDEMEVELDSDGIAVFTVRHPVKNLSNDSDKEITIKSVIKENENSFKELIINLKRNEDSPDEQDIIGDRTIENDACGILVKEHANENLSRTHNQIVNDVQQLFIYDLDLRDTASRNNRNPEELDRLNGVDGYYGNDTHNVIRTFIQQLDDNTLMPSQILNGEEQHKLRGLDINEQLNEYLSSEYNYNYEQGKILDRQILIGEGIYNDTQLNQIDGLLEVLNYNENHQNINSRSIVNTNTTGEFESLLGDDNTPWIEIYNNNRINHAGNPPIYIRLEENYMQRLHTGIDKGGGSNIFAPLFIRIRDVDPYNYTYTAENGEEITNHMMRIHFELMGIGYSIFLRHLDLDESVIDNKIYYPEKEITAFPTLTDGSSTAPHVHIEAWRIRERDNSSRLCDLDNGFNEPNAGSGYYIRRYNRTLNNPNPPDEFTRITQGDGFHFIQPTTPFI